MIKKILGAVSAISLVLLAGLLFFTTPTDIGPLGILLFFILLYIVSLGVFTAAIWCISRIVTRTFKGRISSKPLRPMSDRKSYYLGTVLAFVPVLVLAMQSFGGIGLLEFGLMSLFVLISSILVLKR